MDKSNGKSLFTPGDPLASCQICQDLLPLVKDQVASEDSMSLVKAHLERCESCRQLCGEADCLSREIPQVNDQKVLSAVKKRLVALGVGVLLLGSVLGVALSNSMGMFYNFTLMPFLGAVGYFTFPRRWYAVPGGILGLSYLWMLVSYGLEGSFESGIAAGLATPLYLAVIYTLLALLGVAVAMLLRFAFQKDRRADEQTGDRKQL